MPVTILIIGSLEDELDSILEADRLEVDSFVLTRTEAKEIMEELGYWSVS